MLFIMRDATVKNIKKFSISEKLAKYLKIV
jgi:hypothetical protein